VPVVIAGVSGDSSPIAHGPRRRGAIALRGLRYVVAQAPRRIADLGIPDGVASVGIVADRHDAGTAIRDAVTRVAWALDGRLRVIVSDTPSERCPDWADPELCGLARPVAIGDPNRADLVLLASATGLRWMRRIVQRKVLITDPNWYSEVEVDTYAALSSLGVTSDDWDDINAQSRSVFNRLRERYSGTHRVAVFGTGPSMTSIDPASIDAGLTIACNSAVSNLEWIERARPGLIVFADPVFHFGPSRYAGAFRQDLLRIARISDTTFAIPHRFAPLMMRRFPELQDRLIAVRPQRGLELDSLSRDQLRVPQTSNVLTLMMLPFSLALGQEVVIAGCDGRKPDEKYFWRHSAQAQYGGSLMSSTFDAHPSFFRDRDYVAYYRAHCNQLESMLSSAEERGYRFTSATPSAIPALARRDKGS